MKNREFLIFLIQCFSTKVSNFKLSVTLSKLNRFLKRLHSWIAYELATNPILHHPAHHVATIPWEIKKFIFLQIFSRY